MYLEEIKILNRTIFVPKDPIQADIFIGMWRKAQTEAIVTFYKTFEKNDYQKEDFDLKEDKMTINNYRRIKNGG